MSSPWLITGGTGFLGRHIVQALGPKESTLLTRRPVEGFSFEIGDLAGGRIELRKTYTSVVHAGGLAHKVPKTPEEKTAFFQVNLEGTRKLLTALEANPPKAFVFVSTVAVYGVEQGTQLDESAPLQATDPYGESKRLAEEEVSAWCQKRGVFCSILRLPLLTGRLAPGNLGAMVAAIKRGRYLRIGGGQARRSMVRAWDIANALPVIAKSEGIFNLTDGCHPSFAELEATICKATNRPLPKNLPLALAKAGGIAGDIIEKLAGRRFPLTSRVVTKMTSTLTFSDAKARAAFGWSPEPVLSHPEELL